MKRTTLVVPCFNEAARLDPSGLALLLDDPGVDLLLVDDGSTDATRTLLEDFARTRPERIHVLALSRNSGKAEAVRRGLVTSLEADRSALVGYLDADLSTPPSEMHRLIAIMRDSSADALLGARVALLGREIARQPARHYLGRVFATLASLALRIPVYDTQCGAKLFRVTPMLVEALRDPFLSRWAFDVELLGRLLIGSRSSPPVARANVWEEPLRAWRDVEGSKLSPRQMSGALFDLARIVRDLERRRAVRRSALLEPQPRDEHAEPARIVTATERRR